MKKKTINKTLKSIHRNLCETIKDPNVKQLVEDNTIITGGCITSMLLQEDVNDYDLYFRNKETAFAVASYYVDSFRELKKKLDEKDNGICAYEDKNTGRVKLMIPSKGVAVVDDNGYKYFEAVPDEAEAEEYVGRVWESVKKESGSKYQPILLTANAITLSDKVQIVIRFYGEPEEIHKNYDFVHVTNYWTSWDQEVVTNTEALECILARELRYIGSLYPLCSMIRLRKFIKRGWSIHAGQMLKIAFQISELDFTDISVLEEQLTGVDFAYFSEVIDILRGEKDRAIDATYLAEVVDRVFE